MSLTHRANSIRRPFCGFTLIETVMSMVVMTIIVAAMTSAMVLMARATSLDKTASSTGAFPAAQARSAVDRITDDLKVAISISDQSPTNLVMTVPDRDGDNQPETIHYAWSGRAGDPVTMQYNNGSAVTLVDNVGQFNLQHIQRTVGPPAPPPPVESAEQLLNSSDAILLVTTFGLKNSNLASEYFQPSLPSNAVSWKITRIKVQIKRNGTSTTDAIFNLMAADAQNKPTGTVLETVSLPITAIGANQTAWVEFPCSNMSGLDPSRGYCIVANSNSSQVNYYVNYATLLVGGGGAFATVTNNGNWTTPSTLKAMQYYVYGTVTTQP